MAITYGAITKVGSQMWEYEWTGTSPYNVWRCDTGEQIMFASTSTTLQISGRGTFASTYSEISNDEPVPIEVYESTDTTIPACVTYPPYAIIQWRGSTANAFYRIQQLDAASSWTTRYEQGETDNGYYSQPTRTLSDVTTHNWRVLPYDTQGNAGDPVQFDVFMVRNPDPPSVNLSWSSSAAAIVVSS